MTASPRQASSGIGPSGKPAMYAEIEGADPLGLDEVSEAIGKIADELRDKREAKAASPT